MEMNHAYYIFRAFLKIAAFIFTRKRKINVWAFFDFLMPYVALAQSIGRWGNFVNQEAQGAETTLPWRMEIFDLLKMQRVAVHPTFRLVKKTEFRRFIKSAGRPIMTALSYISSYFSFLKHMNQSRQYVSSLDASTRSFAAPHDPAGGIITSSPGLQSAGVATPSLSAF